MSSLKNVIGTAVFAAGVALASQASAHHVFTEEVAMPVVAPGASVTLTIHCPHHHYSVSGGYEAGDRVSPNGPMMATGSYPGTTQSWSVEFTNRSGRPTIAGEATATLYVTCQHHW